MIEIQTELAELFEGEVAGGRNFWWVEGSDTILSQEWNHRAAGREFESVEAYHIGEDTPVDYLIKQWSEYKIIDVVKVEGL